MAEGHELHVHPVELGVPDMRNKVIERYDIHGPIPIPPNEISSPALRGLYLSCLRKAAKKIMLSF